jgi:hypothetical protein
VKAVSEAAKALVAERLLLEEDAARFVKESQSSNVLTAPSTR